ncbi:gliding motility-associated C-terminal domain-containing protein [Ferruginibacter sp. HRS2-29]|uniref:gliding motility-associated C-terminal domain-containing protein n=1 Tax=Ferruginibacter sp. HRS2-29 TaxID=2487334 RepID=UPI0020CC073A|nr:gliding motility-associated C-terminal domain-containing protein [Ferruginibacter sp. HRS2-29]MCP9752982.1 gliding motility-associated C-terminal domain-containing protein [Ferruginibacter sp. HRS2-29]
MLNCIQAGAQAPKLNWALKYGGSSVDIPFSIKFTADGGTIVAGYTDSKDGQVNPQPNREYWDLWVLKLDACGNVQWERSLGGTGYESARDIVPTADGGYLVLGETNSTDGGVAAGYGGTKDIWLIKLSATGNVLWQKRYGGNGLDIGNKIKLMADGNYLIAATTSSNDGDISGNHSSNSYTDGLLMKVSPAGALLWSKCFGGSKNDELLDMEIVNGKIYAIGYANSVDGDIPPSQKNYDVWVLALDAGGNKMYSKIYGGSQNDVAYAVSLGVDGSLCLAGYTTSTDGDVSGPKGSQDYWVLNITQSGTLNWQKVLGGTDADYANTILTETDGSYLVGGISYSDDGDITDAKGEGDYWLVKLSATGNVIWKQNWGGNGNDNLRCLLHKQVPDEYYLAGDSDSYGDFTNGFGDADLGIIKLNIPLEQTKDTTVCNISTYVPFKDTLQDVCGNDSVLVTYTPVQLSGPLEGLKKRDTVFIGQSLTLPSSGNGTIHWVADPTLSCTACANPVATPRITTIYTATNTLPHGCVVEDKFTLVVLHDAVVFTPTAFTPNGDGKNDYFGPLGKVPDGFSIQIFNKYGETVFKSSSMPFRWDGRYKGIIQPTGGFVYIMQYQDMQKKVHQQKGSFMLIR